MEHKSKKKKGEKQYRLKDLKALGQQLLSSRSHVNNLPRLLSFIDVSSPPQYTLEALLSLQAFFIPLLPDLPSSASSKPSAAASSSTEDDAAAEFIYRTWLRSKFDEFLRSLIALAMSSQSEEALRVIYSSCSFAFICCFCCSMPSTFFIIHTLLYFKGNNPYSHWCLYCLIVD